MTKATGYTPETMNPTDFTPGEINATNWEDDSVLDADNYIFESGEQYLFENGDTFKF